MVSGLDAGHSSRDHVRLATDVIANSKNLRAGDAGFARFVRGPPLFSERADSFRIGTDANNKLPVGVIHGENVVSEPGRSVDDSSRGRSEVTLDDLLGHAPVVTDGCSLIRLFNHELSYLRLALRRVIAGRQVREISIVGSFPPGHETSVRYCRRSTPNPARRESYRVRCLRHRDFAAIDTPTRLPLCARRITCQLP